MAMFESVLCIVSSRQEERSSCHCWQSPESSKYVFENHSPLSLVTDLLPPLPPRHTNIHKNNINVCRSFRRSSWIIYEAAAKNQQQDMNSMYMLGSLFGRATYSLRCRRTRKGNKDWACVEEEALQWFSWEPAPSPRTWDRHSAGVRTPDTEGTARRDKAFLHRQAQRSWSEIASCSQPLPTSASASSGLCCGHIHRPLLNRPACQLSRSSVADRRCVAV